MTQNKDRSRNKQQPQTQPQPAPLQAVSQPVPPLVESAETKVFHYKPEEGQDIPKNRFTRWLYHRSQIILGVLTFVVVLFNAVQWAETRNTRALENRAYIVARTVRLEAVTFPDANDVLIVCVNAGRTPGRNGNIEAVLERRQASPPEDTVINPTEGKKSRILFGPGVEVNHRVAFMNIVQPPGSAPPQLSAEPTNPDKAKGSAPSSNQSPDPTPTPAARDNDKRLWYLYGVVQYEDIFGNTHKTRFCFENVPFTPSWAYCPTFNDAD